MSFKHLVLTAAILTSATNSFAQNLPSPDTGWFVGGSISNAETKTKIDDAPPYKTSDIGFNIYGGYNFTELFGLESSFVTANIQDSGQDASIDALSITPKLTFVINPTISLYLKAGLAFVVVTVDDDYYDYDDDYYYYDDDDYWGGLGVMVGVGAQFSLTDHLKLRLSVDSTDATLEHSTDYYDNYDIETTLTQTALSLHYQF
jgi:opacity protein-like surface antigen